jgi:hypothetical protein
MKRGELLVDSFTAARRRACQLGHGGEFDRLTLEIAALRDRLGDDETMDTAMAMWRLARRRNELTKPQLAASAS